MQKNKTQLTEDLTTFNIDQLDKYIKINGVQAITGLMFNSVLKNLIQRNQDDIDSNFNILTNDTDDINSGTQNRFNFTVETVTDRDNLDPHTDGILGLNVGDISVVQENTSGNMEAFIWDGGQWIQLYEVVDGQLDIKVLDTPETADSAVNKNWVQFNSEMAFRAREEDGVTYRVDFFEGNLLISINEFGDTSSITLTPSSITISSDSIVGLDNLDGSNLTIANLPTYADDAAATIGGLTTNRIYKTATGELRIKL